MSNIKVKTKDIPFVYTKGANINAAYGPWNSLEAAIVAAEEIYNSADPITGNKVTNIPTGLTVGVFANLTLKEYWYNGETFNEKLAGKSEYLLVFLYNGIQVDFITLNMDLITINRIQAGTQVYTGTLEYKKDNAQDWTNVPSTNSISLTDVRNSIEVKWEDSSNELCKKSAVVLSTTEMKFLKFYAYTQTAPSIDSANYLSDDWNPGESWTKNRQSLSIENPIEWGFERYKYNNVWQPYTEPTITGLRGSDGMSVYGKEFIYACSDIYDDVKSTLSDEIQVINTLVGLLPDDAKNGIYFDPSKHPLTTVEHIWYTKLPEISITNRYIFASERTKTGQQEDDFSAWTEPVLVYNFSIGLDGAFTEYLFYNFPNELLYNSTEWNNILSDISIINSSSYVTNLDLEVAGKPFDSNISSLPGLIYHWNLNAKGVSGTNKYEYCIYRKVSCDKFGIKNFGEISIQESPIIWSAFGKEGNDGKGIEYIYILTSTSTPPTIFQLNSTGFDPTNETDYVGKYWHNDEFVPYTDSTKTSRWYDNPQEVTHEYLYLWAAHRKGSEGDWAEFSEPVIWNKYHANYEIFLSNDNATIPASKEGTYTREAAKAATRTEVIVKLGNEEIDYTSEESPITVECEGYEQTGKIWQLTDTTLEFDKGTYLSNFVAKLNNEVVAHKAQSVHLNTNGDSYKLFVTPNSRQWYGGTEYSTENFEFSLYKIDSTGVMTEVQDTSGFKLILQHAGSPSITEMPYTLHLYNFEEGTYHDILITLAQNGKALDKETIDTIDLSSFVDPSQSNAIRISLSNDSPSIPDKDKDDATAVQSHTLVKVQAFSAREAIAITNVTMAANYVSDQTDNIEAHVEAVAGSNNLIYNTWIEFKSGEPQEIKDDILVTLTVKITNGDNEIVDYIVGYRIDLLNASENFVNFQVYPNILTTSSGNLEFDVDNLTFVTLKNFETIYPETINFTFYGLENAITGKLVYSNSAYSWYVYDPNYENNAGYRPISGLNYFSPGNLGEDYTKSSSFLFSISEGEVGKLQVKYQSVEVFFLKYNTVETYDVNLTNSYVTILKGTTDTNILNSLLASSYSIYKGTSSISPSSITYKLDNGSNLSWADLLNAVANITSTLLIHHITYNFTLSNGIVLQKTQTIEIVDRATYKLLCNPTTIIKSSSLSQNVTISVNKYSTSQVITLTGNQLSAEDLYVFVNNTLATISNNQVNVTYLGTDTSVTIELKKLTSQSSYRTEDCESLAIIVEGAKGDTPIQLFKWSASDPSTPTVTALDWSGAGPFDGWYKYVPTRTTGSLYMSQNILQGNGTLASNWSTPVSISGNDGDPGADADNIEWIYNYSDSGYDASVGEKDPRGPAGDNETNKNQDGWVPYNWYNHALAVSNANPTVYASYRKITGTSASKTYGAFNTPIVWSHWGLNGIDGDGVLYVYKLYASALSSTQEESYTPIRGNQKPSGEWEANNSEADQTGTWLDNAPSTTSETPYCYCSVIKRTNSTWGLFGKLSLWSKWSRDGASITKASADTYRYAIGTSGTTPPSSGWSTTKPSTFDLNKWLWTETTIHWSDNTTTVLYSADRNPNDGIDGQSVTITSQSVTYSKQTTGNLDPTTLTYGPYPSSIAKGDWIYSKTTVNYSDGTHTDAYSLSYSGTDGDSGRGISTIVEQYAVNNDKNNAPESSSFSTTFPSSWGVNNKYIWNREVITYTKGSPLTETTTPQIKAIWTKDGKGIDSIVNRYLTNNVASGITKQNYKSYNNGNEWPTAITPTTESNPYLWNFEVITYTDSTSEMTDPHVIGHFGKDGVDGQDGKDGVTIRTFKGTFEEPANIVFRNDSELTGTKKKWNATNQTWVDDTDPVLYKDYYLDITDDEHKIAYVCKLTYVVLKHEGYVGKNLNGVWITKELAWDVAQDLGNAFFTSLYALSGNIELLSSSVLKVNGRLLMQKDVGLGNYEVIGGINGEGGSDQTVVDPTLAFWSGGTGQKNDDGKIDATFYVTKDGEFHGKEGVFNGMYAPLESTLNTITLDIIAKNIDPRLVPMEDENDESLPMDIPLDFDKFGRSTFINLPLVTGNNETLYRFAAFNNSITVPIWNGGTFVDMPHCIYLDIIDNYGAEALFDYVEVLRQLEPYNNIPTLYQWYAKEFGKTLQADSVDLSDMSHLQNLLIKRWNIAKNYIGLEILVRGKCLFNGVMSKESYDYFLSAFNKLDPPPALLTYELNDLYSDVSASSLIKKYTEIYTTLLESLDLKLEPPYYKDMSDPYIWDLLRRLFSMDDSGKYTYAGYDSSPFSNISLYYDLALEENYLTVSKLKCVYHQLHYEGSTIPMIFWVATDTYTIPSYVVNATASTDEFEPIHFIPEENLSES